MEFKKAPFKVGQKVIVRPDNSAKVWQESHKKGEYFNPSYVDSMDRLRGKTVTIQHSLGDTCIIKEDGYNWSWASFLPPNKEELNTMVLNGELDVDTYREMINNM